MSDVTKGSVGSSVGIDLTPLPGELKRKAQFVLWTYEDARGEAGQIRPAKVPYSPQTPNRRASTTSGQLRSDENM